jgi:hypothetical protein
MGGAGTEFFQPFGEARPVDALFPDIGVVYDRVHAVE